MQCPKCKEQMPPLSKICPICGYTDTSMDAYEGNDSISMIMSEMQESLHKVKSLPMPSPFDGMQSISFVSYPLVFLLVFVLAAVSESMIAWVLTLLFLVLSLVAITKKLKGKGSTEKHKNLINTTTSQYELSKQNMLLKYGSSRDIKQAMAQIDNELEDVLLRRKASARKSLLMGIILTAIIMIISWVIVADIAKSAIQEHQTEEIITED